MEDAGQPQEALQIEITDTMLLLSDNTQTVRGVYLELPYRQKSSISRVRLPQPYPLCLYKDHRREDLPTAQEDMSSLDGNLTPRFLNVPSATVHSLYGFEGITAENVVGLSVMNAPRTG